MGCVPLPTPTAGRGCGTAGDSADDGRNVEEDEEEAAEGGEEAEGEGEEDAARGSPKQDVVAEEEHLVDVVLRRGGDLLPAAADHRQSPHFSFYGQKQFPSVDG